MADSDDLEEIRRRKRERLEARLADGEVPGSPDEDEDEAEAPTEPIHVDGADDLASVVEAHGVVLVDFYADWCGPCQMLEPTVESVARDTPAAVAKVDVDANGALAGQYGVSGVPTLVLFADGDPVEQLVGVQDRDTLTGLVEQHAA